MKSHVKSNSGSLSLPTSATCFTYHMLFDVRGPVRAPRQCSLQFQSLPLSQTVTLFGVTHSLVRSTLLQTHHRLLEKQSWNNSYSLIKKTVRLCRRGLKSTLAQWTEMSVQHQCHGVRHCVCVCGCVTPKLSAEHVHLSFSVSGATLLSCVCGVLLLCKMAQWCYTGNI